MSQLHIINKSPFSHGSLEACLRLAKSGSAILLIEDGVYAAQTSTSVSDALSSAMQNHKVYALDSDLSARGLHAERLLAGVETVDYAGFVQLAVDHDTPNSWL